eukprot:TRINITY_DN32020_c0_g1_i1.p1 TRINITY_DN32020_c0_g1~~TRINITY_DN32020_c0_g1_i1.p1  ORF type:complete len:617 (+),score=129.90 TRINITY_DN32020_c0_g1_i1:63-1913(+)
MRECFNKLVSPFVRSDEPAQHKAFVLFVYAVFIYVNITAYAFAFRRSLLSLGMLTGCVACLFALIALKCGIPHKLVVELTLCCLACSCMITELHARTVGAQAWGIMVILVDVALVFQLPRSSTLGLVVVLCVYLTLLQVMQAAGTMSTIRHGDTFTYQGEVPSLCDCSRPPCTRTLETNLGEASVMLMVFLTDFALTRGFATRMQSQMDLVRAAVDLTQVVAQKLSVYEIQQAEEALQGRGNCLPDDIRSAFEQLIRNLEQYRPYIPQSCLISNDEEVSEAGDVSVRNSVEVTRADTPHVERSETVSSNGPGLTPVETSHLRASFMLRQEARRKRVSMLCGNHFGFCSFVETSTGREVAEWLARRVSKFETAVRQTHGILDLISADHFFASFNGALHSASHQIGAVQCASLHVQPDLGDVLASASGGLETSAAVVSGCAVCGDFGSNTATRFMMLTRRTSLLFALERLGTALRLPVLMEDSMYDAVALHYAARLCAVAVYRAKFPDQNVRVWEVWREHARVDQQEWMYAIEAIRDPWDGYNAAMQLWISGGAERAESRLAELLKDDGGDGYVLEQAKQLLRRIRAGEDPAVEIVECIAPKPEDRVQIRPIDVESVS